MKGTEALASLWQLAFGDSREFIDLFFSTAYSPENCGYLSDGDTVTAALYWLDCEFAGQKMAYVYAVATHPAYRGRGLCRALMHATHRRLQARGYAAVLLCPARKELRAMYAALGYRECTTVEEFRCAPRGTVALRQVDAAQYAALRRQYLPEDGVIQEGPGLAYLAAYAGLWAGEGFVLAGSGDGGEFLCTELLGDRSVAPGILGALGYAGGTFRCPGTAVPFAMWLPLDPATRKPGYLGLAFD